MGREVRDAPRGRITGDTRDTRADEVGLATRLRHLERAHQQLLDRLHGYEREREEIKRRLGRILRQIGQL